MGGCFSKHKNEQTQPKNIQIPRVDSSDSVASIVLRSYQIQKNFHLDMGNHPTGEVPMIGLNFSNVKKEHISKISQSSVERSNIKPIESQFPDYGSSPLPINNQHQANFTFAFVHKDDIAIIIRDDPESKI